MEIFWALLLFTTGVVLIIYAGNWFVDAASWIARAIKIPPFIVGATIVSLATTLPEMIVSLMASFEGKSDMMVGNAVGSVTANTGLILAIAFLFMTITTPRKNYLLQCLMFVAASAILWLGCLTGTLELWASIVLILIFIAFMCFNVKSAQQDKTEISLEPMLIKKKDVFFNIFLFIIGAAGIVGGSELLINGGSTLATALGVPERIIAITMVAIGTSLPELITTITAIRKKEANLSAGNVIGANIIDLTLILPLCSFVSPQKMSISNACLIFDFPACLIICLIAVIPLIFKQRSYKWQGALMLTLYLAYIFISSIF